jgi:1,4-alpha-glucan branching enzyme
MPGDEWQRHATLRAYYGFMWMHPGKKLLFMGGEIAQEREWCHDGELDWQLLQRPLHAGLQRLVRDLNALYRDAPALYTLDCEAAGFEWVEFADAKHSVFAWLRRGREPGSVFLVVSNFTPVPRRAFRLGVDAPGFWRERINTDSTLYGGSNVGNAGGLHSEAVPRHGRAHSLRVSLPPLATVVFEYSVN